MKYVNIFNWIARIWGGLSLMFILSFMILYFIGDTETDSRPINQQDIIGIGIGLMAIVGLFLAFKWPGLGGTMSVIALVYFKLSGPLEFSLIDVLLFPGILYLITWYLQSRRTTSSG